jgi:hypothetical protein
MLLLHSAQCYCYSSTIEEVLTTSSSGWWLCKLLKKSELFHATFEVDFLANGALNLFKLRTLVAQVWDYRLAENEKKIIGAVLGSPPKEKAGALSWRF